ncbi:MAG: sarcosine oxidase subunit gamma [Roseinatronobacter sp.]
MSDLIPDLAAPPHRAGALALIDAPMAIATLARLRGAGPLDLALPGPGAYLAGTDHAALWLAPDHWLILWPDTAVEDRADGLSRTAPGWAVTDQSGGFAAFRVTGPGPDLMRLLERLVNLDPASLAPGCAVRTRVLHLGVVVIRPAPETVIFLAPGSAAVYFRAQLCDRLDLLAGAA